MKNDSHGAMAYDINKSTGLFGGTFDPVHEGHVNVVRRILEGDAVEQIIIVPAARPPHKSGVEITAPGHRMAMLARAFPPSEGLYISDYELQRTELSYTIHTARWFRQAIGTELYLIIGTDSLAELHTWYAAKDLVAECRFLIYPRPGYEAPEVSELSPRFGPAEARRLLDAVVSNTDCDVSSSDVRGRLAEGKDVSSLLPASVSNYIRTNGLYGCSDS